MGNFCCSDDLNRGPKYEEYHFDIDKSVSVPNKNPMFVQSHLETVKEEPIEYSEQSEYRSVSRGSKNRG
ncbi:hypothetical protein SteCoe_17139 [Stentor coeruleus]|uniref:Uncharacterized protein n=1 Tax=Stentor coeruleus TaxID=5963 RepID=A0A1R2BZN4_9CILI|nr:hypothetical protein SteCoe_17139 [Stentor coeruleus]